MRRSHSFLIDQAGAAAAEMALVLPMLLALMFGCLEGAHYLYIEHQIVKGVRDGARFAARQSFTNYSCSSTSVGSSSVETEIKNVTRTGQVSGGASRVSGWTDADVTVSVSCPSTAITTGIYSDFTNAPQVTVSSTVAYPSLFGTLSGLTTSFKVHSRDQAAVMGV